MPAAAGLPSGAGLIIMASLISSVLTARDMTDIMVLTSLSRDSPGGVVSGSGITLSSSDKVPPSSFVSITSVPPPSASASASASVPVTLPSPGLFSEESTRSETESSISKTPDSARDGAGLTGSSSAPSVVIPIALSKSPVAQPSESNTLRWGSSP